MIDEFLDGFLNWASNMPVEFWSVVPLAVFFGICMLNIISAIRRANAKRTDEQQPVVRRKKNPKPTPRPLKPAKKIKTHRTKKVDNTKNENKSTVTSEVNSVPTVIKRTSSTKSSKKRQMRGKLQQAIITKEILEKPVSLRKK